MHEMGGLESISPNDVRGFLKAQISIILRVEKDGLRN